MSRAPALLLLLLAMATPALSAESARDARSETVVLLHGVAMGPFVMARLETSLRRAGYRVVNLRYPSRTAPLERIADDHLPARLREAGVDGAPRVHFVAHSMGCLLLRLYLRDHRPANLGRVVMLAPPNQGSTAADHAVRSPLLRALLGRNVGGLGTGDDAIARRLGPVDFETGVIAGNRGYNPVTAGWLARPHDGAVTVAAARVDGMRDFLEVPYAHTPMLWRRPVIDQVLAFLRDGRFGRPPSTGQAGLAGGRS